MPMRLQPQAAISPAALRQDATRARDFALRVGPLYASFARQGYDRSAWAALQALAQEAGLAAAMRRLVDGEHVNASEDRAALHTALRGAVSAAPAACSAKECADAARVQMRQQVEAITADARITDVISIGVGGSDLGPRLAVDALAGANPRLRVHFVSNVDAHAISRTLAGLNPAHCIGILVSKSFGTQETRLNGQILRQWLQDDTRLHAVTANPARAEAEFAIAPERILPMWEWVGGRYSLWSAVGLPLALAVGMDRFEQLLAGAAAFDRHALEAPASANLAVFHALTAIWNQHALGARTQAVLPYDERLRLLPAYLQQLAMESLGKQAAATGAETVPWPTSPVWWGGVGSDCQHSFFQALHQGHDLMPVDFIGVIEPAHAHRDNHDVLLANLLAQSEALANGQASADVHRHYPGARPSTLLLLDRLDAGALGHLLALYEHSVYLQSVLLGINAFDQFGVELGKRLANGLLPVLRGEGEAEDPITRELVAQLRRITPS